ncbi:hypothetical protein NADFUDRAFT_41307 [Nadsonia fulvescens var. elongata DSM 6958]|uniref:Mitochondrial intermembrane space import and assembly protein 40 n=1 Tax=Nadsonia fulvescens var. elongata DSM 6958 TaxID=857566 RepID=A0A1E3PN12_9ASCO|nr:hypothetical protein NADFUDRAFT_41307 [Nadsonia fulvescens var. elongata DSM 6958]
MLRQLTFSTARRFTSVSLAKRYSTATRSTANQSARHLLFAGVATISGLALATYTLSSPILADEKKSVKAPKKENYMLEKPLESEPESDSTPKKAGSSSEEHSPETPKGEEKPQSAYNPETGEINWDCPCLGGMAHGPCGEDFKAAFSCFVYSEAEPKGVDCIEKFSAMQDCFRQYPEVYSEELRDDAEASSPKEEQNDSPKTESVKKNSPKEDTPKTNVKDDSFDSDAKTDAKVQTVASALSDAIEPVTSAAFQAVQPVVERVKPIGDAAQPIIDAAAPAAHAIGDAAGPVTAAVISSAAPMARAVGHAAKPVTDAIGNAAKPYAEAAVDAVKPYTDAAVETAKPYTDAVSDAAKRAKNAVEPFVKEATEAVESKEQLLKDNAPVDSDKPSKSA